MLGYGKQIPLHNQKITPIDIIRKYATAVAKGHWLDYIVFEQDTSSLAEIWNLQLLIVAS